MSAVEKRSISAKTEPISTIGGLPITSLGKEDSARLLVDTALQARGQVRRPYYSTSANGQVIALARIDAAFRELLTQADQIHPDGMPMVILSGVVSQIPLRERVATTDLIHDVARLSEADGVSFYFLGGTEEVNRAAVARMKQAYPKLVVAGARSGYFTPEEETGVVDEIARLRPDILWIGLGVPLEQRFVARNIERLKGVGVIKTSGGLFDFLSGRNSRAPRWMQAVGLEWVYRIILEPRRLLGRYLTTNFVAMWQIMRHSR
jgi:N-acetylglucosaminyldiphosphoundecaprenol N-acetyl-beta-D-mannosaminyltransferase